MLYRRIRLILMNLSDQIAKLKAHLRSLQRQLATQNDQLVEAPESFSTYAQNDQQKDLNNSAGFINLNEIVSRKACLSSNGVMLKTYRLKDNLERYWTIWTHSKE